MLGHKTSLNKGNRIEIIQSVFSSHNGIKLEISNRKKSENSSKKKEIPWQSSG